MPDVGFTIGGDNSEFLAAIKESQSAVSQAAAAIKESLKGVSGGFHEVTEDVHGIGGALDEVRDKIESAFKFAGITAAGEAIEKIGEEIEKISAEARQLSTDSQLLGVSVEQFQAMAHAAEEAGVGTETLTHAGERLLNMLNEARNGSSSATDKLLTLGITAQQIQNPLFGINDLFGILRDRLNNTGTAQQTMSALLQTLGNRAASAAVALKAYDGSAESVAKVMEELNGLNEKQVDSIKRVGAAYDDLKTKASNTFKQFLVGTGEPFKAPSALSMSNAGSAQLASQDVAAQSAGSGPSTEVAQQASQTREQIAQEEAQNMAVIQQKILEDGLKNIQAGLSAYKEGTAERLAALRNFAAAAANLYGQDAPLTEQANEKVLEAQRSYDEQQKKGIQELTDFSKTMDNELELSHKKMNLEKAKDDANYVQEARQFQQQLNQLTEAGAAVSESVVKLQAEGAKQIQEYNKQVRADFEKQYKGIEASVTNSISGALTNMLTRTKSFRQEMDSIFQSLVGAIIKHFVQIGVQWAATQLENLVLSKLTAKGQVEASAGAAGAAGVASFAGAPWPVDLGAPAFGAGMYAAAQTFAVAERGFDIPSGVNPMTQLHQNEMVLPAGIADTIRTRMAGGGSNEGPSSVSHHTHHWQVDALDGHSVASVLSSRRNQNQINRMAEAHINKLRRR